MEEALVNSLEIYEEDTAKGGFFTVCMGKSSYGIEINYVTKIIGLHEMRQITGVHNYVKGIINFRERLIPVIDVKIRSNKEIKIYNITPCILVIEIQKNLVGIIVDGSNENEVLNMDVLINYLVMMNLIKL